MNTNNLSQPDAAVDRLLADFFKSELPESFPAFTPPRTAKNAANPVRERPMARSRIAESRLALAASVALLLGGCWYLSGKMGESSGRVNTGKGDTNAKIPKELLKAKLGSSSTP